MFTIGKSTTGINGRFVFSQVLIDCLLRMESNQDDIDELILFLKTRYEGNYNELRNIDEFRGIYSSDKALELYTYESFYYRTLNQALRCQNFDMMFLYRSFITDIYRQLRSIQYQSNDPLCVYRGQLMTTVELEELKQHIGQYISINSFLSTTKDRTVAACFSGNSNQQNHMEQVFFEINADPKVAVSQPFADISAISRFPDESEVLFMIGSIFRLNGISYDSNQTWAIQMTMCSDDEHDFKDVLAHMKKENGDGVTNARTFGKILWQMGKLDLAEKYFERFLVKLPPNGSRSLTRNVYQDLAQITSQRGHFDISMKWRQKLLTIKRYQHKSLKIKRCQHKSNDNTSQMTMFPNVKWISDGVTVAGGNKKGNGLNQLFYPWGLTIDDNQTIYVADCVNDRIMEWTLNATDGRIVAGGNDEGSETNQMDGPRAVIVDKRTDSFIICDSRNRRIVRWPRQGGTTGEVLISNTYCFDVAMDSDGFIYVCDVERDEVKRWKIGDQMGTIVAGGNGKGNRLDQLHSPSYIFVDHEHSVYVSDSNNHRIMKWKKDAFEGIVVAGDNGPGNSVMQLHNPQGIVVDPNGVIYIADYRNDRIMYWPKGASQGSVAIGVHGQGNQANQLNRPRGLCLDKSGNLYVIDHWNHRVQRFSCDIPSDFI